jgi:hypothetical protein
MVPPTKNVNNRPVANAAHGMNFSRHANGTFWYCSTHAVPGEQHFSLNRVSN